MEEKSPGPVNTIGSKEWTHDPCEHDSDNSSIGITTKEHVFLPLKVFAGKPEVSSDTLDEPGMRYEDSSKNFITT